MNERRLAHGPLLSARSWAQSRAAKLLFGLGLAASLPESVDAARKNDRANNRKNDSGDRERNSDSNRDKRQDEGSEDKQSKDKSESRDKEDRNRNSDSGSDADSSSSAEEESKRSRRRADEESRSEDQDRKDDRDSTRNRDNDRDLDRRTESSRQDADSNDADATDDASDGDDGGRGHRQARDFSQTVDDEPATTTVGPINPNVTITDTTSVDDVELTVQSNPNVIASVSSNGGFAFARSGDITVISGPDGPSIIQGEVTAVVTEPPVDDTPSDGGNNDVGFES